MAISSYPSNHPVCHDIIPNVEKHIAERPVASPSNPSVKLTALLLAVRINKINMP